MTIDHFSKGTSVNVTYRNGDLFNHDFTGTVKDHRHGNIVVEDQDGDCWEVEPSQVSFCSDEYIH